jgi:FixJ family two-component response regulator
MTESGPILMSREGISVTTTPAPIVHVVDDDGAVRTALTRLLRAAGFAVRTYASAGEFLLVPPVDEPGCLVLDVSMPGPSGLDLQESLAQRRAPLPIVFLTGQGDIPMSVRAMKAGAVDFLTKPVKRQALLNAVRSAVAREAQQRTSFERRRRLWWCHNTLTPREREVFVHVVTGKLNKQIAAELGTTERTVKAHRVQVMHKMRVSSLAELVYTAAQLGVGLSRHLPASCGREVAAVAPAPPPAEAFLEPSSKGYRPHR